MYLVDTNVFSEARRKSIPALDWFNSVDHGSIYLSAMTIGEIMKSIASRQRSDPAAAGHLAAWLRKLRQDHRDRILPVTDAVASEWGRIAAIRPRGDIDGIIAATAIVNDLVLVTRNRIDFQDRGVSIINPWDR